MIVPQLEELSNDGEQGRQKINQYNALPVRADGVFAGLRHDQPAEAVVRRPDEPRPLPHLHRDADHDGRHRVPDVARRSHQRSEGRNGISILIFAGIVSGLPSVIQQAILTYDPSRLVAYVGFLLVAIATVAGVVIISEAQRNVPVTYAKRVVGAGMAGGSNTHLPLRVNMAGVIPIIFAISIILFPSMIASSSSTRRRLGRRRGELDPDRVAEPARVRHLILRPGPGLHLLLHRHRLQAGPNRREPAEAGRLRAGHPPGQADAEYLMYAVNRITLAGAVAIAVIAVLPLLVQQFLTGTQNLVVGGSSLLIIVSVVLEIVGRSSRR